MMMTDEQFQRMRKLALDLAGIELVERHHQLLQRRTRHRGIPDADSLENLLSAAERGETAARQQMVYLLTTKFTGFFRHPDQFEISAKTALAAATAQRRRARIWSAAAATGEEPYSMAMTLIETSGNEQPPPVEILATDVDSDAIESARRAEYGHTALQPLTPARHARFFTEVNSDARPRRWRITPEVSRLVEFRELNLAGAAWPIEGKFDVIFCRNVLMYLGQSRRVGALTCMATMLTPAGLLILDPAEHLGQAEHLYSRTPVDGVFTLRIRS